MKLSRKADKKIEAYQQELIKTHFAEVDSMYSERITCTAKCGAGGTITAIIFRF